jgi:pimeloyl-ACP methyl ester carboxylesterase
MRNTDLIDDLVKNTPTDDTFYSPDLVPGGAVGDPLYLRPLENTFSAPEGGENWLVRYRSETAGENPAAIATSGIIVLPDSAKHPVPEGGYPLICWCHGTVGVANRVAPSRDTGDTGASPMNVYPKTMLTRFIDRGWAVAMTDYEALGTGTATKLHPYLLGQSEARAALDIVLATHRLFGDEVSAKFAIVGHSQGGQAALFAAANAPGRVDGLELVGVAAIAPANHSLGLIRAGASPLNTAQNEGYSFTPLFLAGAIAGSIADEGTDGWIKIIDPEQVLSDDAYALWPEVLEKSRAELSATDSFGGLTGNNQFRKATAASGYPFPGIRNEDQKEFDRQVEKMNPDVPISVPVRISQARADQRVYYDPAPLLGTKKLITELENRLGEENVTSKVYEMDEVTNNELPLKAHFTTINVDTHALIGWLLDQGLEIPGRT